nr:hypothetical protein [Klebsiella pneumoniae]
MALAAMDSSESVELPLDYQQGHKDGLEWAAQLAEANHPETGDWLYDDPIELSKAIRKGPDMPPVQPAADSEPVAWTWHYREQWHVTNDKCRAEFVATDGDVAVLPLYRHAQPAQEYPEVLPCPVLLEPGMRFGKGVKIRLVLEAIQRRAEHCAELEAMTPDGRAEYDANIEAFKAMLPQPAQVVPDGYVMVPKEPTEEMLQASYREAAVYSPTAYRAMIAAAKHDTPAMNSIQSVDTVADRWIPVSEQKPDCWCRTCRPVTLNDMRFVVCPDCGNKRCPRANDHRNACTRSNEPGQEGSAYPAAPQEVRGE